MAHRCGLYRAVVSNNVDPESRGRIQITCAQLWGEAETDWIEPILPSSTPAVGSQVWIVFEAGDEDHPVWFGTP